MKIEIELSWQEIKERFVSYIESQVYQHWDHGMSLKQCEDEGADVPGMSPCPYGHLAIYKHVQDAVEQTVEVDFEEGFPRGGMPDELRQEIDKHATGVMYEWFGPPPTKRKKKARKK